MSWTSIRRRRREAASITAGIVAAFGKVLTALNLAAWLFGFSSLTALPWLIAISLIAASAEAWLRD